MLRLKVQLMHGDEIALGPGKADLLDAIRAHGSISAAARAMGMSYRRAWLLVDTMNRCWDPPLVATGPGNTGARLTEAGEQALAAYRALLARVDDAARGEALAALERGLRKSPGESA